MYNDKLTIERITEYFTEVSSAKHRKSMKRLGIASHNIIGVPIPIIRNMAKQIKKNQNFANELWDSNIHELKLLAVLLSEPNKFSQTNLYCWFDTLDSWDLCDHLCNNLLYKIRECYENIRQYCLDEREFVRRTTFSLLVSALSHKVIVYEWLDEYFELFETYSTDRRTYVKKSISWALREMGKRLPEKRDDVISLSLKFQNSDCPTQRWIGKSVYQEFLRLAT